MSQNAFVPRNLVREQLFSANVTAVYLQGNVATHFRCGVVCDLAWALH